MTVTSSLRAAGFVAVAAVALCSAGCTRLAEIAQQGAPAEVSVGSALLAKRDITGARAQFDQAIRKSPGNPQVVIYVMQAAAANRFAPLVQEYMDRGVKALPPDASHNSDRAAIYEAACEFFLDLHSNALAIRAGEAAFRLAPQDPVALNALGYAYAEADANLPEAVSLTTQALEMARKQNSTPDQLGLIQDSIGWAYFKLGKSAESTNNLQAAAELAPGHKEIYYHMARVYRMSGNDADAEVAVRRALAVDPTYVDARDLAVRLGMALPPVP